MIYDFNGKVSGMKRKAGKIIKMIALIAAGYVVFQAGKQVKLYMESSKRGLAKSNALMKMYVTWLQNRSSDKSISQYLKEINIESAAIYGMGPAGKLLLSELKREKFNVKYGIDRNFIEMDEDFKIVTIEELLEQVDAIIVTAINDYDEIKKNLDAKVNYRIISLEQIIFEIDYM